MKKNLRPPRSGFTLVEMLVVIAIIGILAAILVPTIYYAVGKSKETRIAVELNEISIALEEYKQSNGAYPPDFSTLQYGDLAPVLSHLRRVWPKRASANTFVNTNMTLPTKQPAGIAGTPFDTSTLDPSEAIVFWLGMVKKDSRQPLNGPGEPESLFSFDETRLVDLDGDGWLSYLPKVGGDYRAPFVYFNSRTYNYSGQIVAPGATPPGTPLCKWIFDVNLGDVAYPYQSVLPNPGPLVNYGAVQANFPTPPAVIVDPCTTAYNKQYELADKFQLISAGLDGEFGKDPYASGTGSPKVAGPSCYFSKADDDNITNFSGGKTLQDLGQ